MGLLVWIVVGLTLGWLAGQVIKGRDYSAMADIVLGMLGGLVGGWLLGRLLDDAERRRATSSMTPGRSTSLKPSGRPAGLQQGRLPACDS
jgi:uncharacterized membrane protein YeaQ/YmgE (transglycosylase-associated protein family)